MQNPLGFWDQVQKISPALYLCSLLQQARENIEWFAPYTEVYEGKFHEGNIAWFVNGKINVSYNCVDRHAAKHPHRIAIIYEGDEPTDIVKITFGELLERVCCDYRL